MATEAHYREQHRAAQQRWCKRRPLHRYQAQYRQSHPDYVEKIETSNVCAIKRAEDRRQPHRL